MRDRADDPYVLISRQENGFAFRGEAQFHAGAPGDGAFAEWNWNGQRLICRNDRFGFQPLFYFQQRDTIAISPSVIRLLELGAPRALDRAAVAVFLRLGFFLGNDTAFSAIRAMPPNGILDWNGHQPQISGGYPSFTAEPMSRDSAIDVFIDSFRTAIRRSLPQDENFAVPLSGGRDSRQILLELLAAGLKPKVCPTVKHFPPRANTDAAVASKLTAALRVEHKLLSQPHSRVSAELSKNLRTGFCSDELAFLMPLAGYLPGSVSTVYDGLAGDVLSAGHLQDDRQRALFASKSFRKLSELLISHRWFQLSEAVLGDVLQPDFYKEFDRETALARLNAELERHGEAPNPAASFLFWNRTRREIALSPFRLLAKVQRVICPYLHNGLCDFLLSLPAELTSDGRFHTDAILRAYPAARDIPFARSDATVKDRWFQRRFAGELLSYAVHHSRSMTRRSRIAVRLLRRVLDGRHEKLRWLQPSRLLWLLQLDDFIGSK